MGLFLGAEQVDVECNEEFPRTCDSGAPTGDKGARAEVRHPLYLFELQEHSRGVRWRGPRPAHSPQGKKNGREDTQAPIGAAPSQAGPHTLQPG